MKKTLQMVCILALFVLFGVFLFFVQSRNIQFTTDDSGTLVLSLKADGSEKLLYPWVNEADGLTYFFLPSFVQGNRIFFDRKETIEIDGEAFSCWNSFEWEDRTVYSISCEGQEYEVVFMKSANLPSLFL